MGRKPRASQDPKDRPANQTSTNKPNPPKKSRVGRSWLGLIITALLLLGFIWWQDQRNLVTLENQSTQTFSGTLTLPDGRVEPIDLTPGKSGEWAFEATKEGHVEIRGKMGEALIRVKGAKVEKGQWRARANFKLTPDGNAQLTNK